MAFWGFILVIAGSFMALFWKLLNAIASMSSSPTSPSLAQTMVEDWMISWMKHAIFVVPSFGFTFVAFAVGWGQLILMGKCYE